MSGQLVKLKRVNDMKHKNNMKVLTVDKTIIRGNYTYSLMGDYIHIDNHKTNSNSMIVPTSAIKELLSEEGK